MTMTRQAGRNRRVGRNAEARTTPPNRQVNIHIGELVLHGFPAHDRRRIARAMERELARLCEDEGQPESWRPSLAVERIDGGAIKVATRSGAAKTGRDIARAVYRGLRKDDATPLEPGGGVRHE